LRETKLDSRLLKKKPVFAPGTFGMPAPFDEKEKFPPGREFLPAIRAGHGLRDAVIPR